MGIIFENNYYLYAFVYLVIPIMILIGAEFTLKKEGISHILAKNDTDIIKGLSVLAIVVHHVVVEMPNQGFMRPFILAGYLGVGVFLFMSGYGLMISLLKKENYLKGFVTKRISKIYLPFFITNIFFIMMSILLLDENYGIETFLLSSIEIKFPGFVLWYVKATFLFYLVFYLVFKYFKQKNGIKLVFLYALIYTFVCRYVLQLDTYWYNTAFCFPVGVYFAFHKDLIITFIKHHYYQVVGFSFLLFALTTIIYYKNALPGGILFNIFSALSFIVFLISIIHGVQLTSKILTFIGQISYEMYLVHLVMLHLYFNLLSLEGSFSFYIYLVITFILSIGISKFVNFITSSRKKAKVISSQLAK